MKAIRERLFRRDAETNARDGRAPQTRWPSPEGRWSVVSSPWFRGQWSAVGGIR
jgi:hypothetical protein